MNLNEKSWKRTIKYPEIIAEDFPKARIPGRTENEVFPFRIYKDKLSGTYSFSSLKSCQKKMMTSSTTNGQTIEALAKHSFSKASEPLFYPLNRGNLQRENHSDNSSYNKNGEALQNSNPKFQSWKIDFDFSIEDVSLEKPLFISKVENEKEKTVPRISDFTETSISSGQNFTENFELQENDQIKLNRPPLLLKSPENTLTKENRTKRNHTNGFLFPRISENSKRIEKLKKQNIWNPSKIDKVKGKTNIIQYQSFKKNGKSHLALSTFKMISTKYYQG